MWTWEWWRTCLTNISSHMKIAIMVARAEVWLSDDQPSDWSYRVSFQGDRNTGGQCCGSDRTGNDSCEPWLKEHSGNRKVHFVGLRWEPDSSEKAKGTPAFRWSTALSLPSSAGLRLPHDRPGSRLFPSITIQVSHHLPAAGGWENGRDPDPKVQHPSNRVIYFQKSHVHPGDHGLWYQILL